VPRNILLQPIAIAAAQDGEGRLVMVDGQLAGVLVRLDDELHAEHRGAWFLEAGFGIFADLAGNGVFATLEQATHWLAMAG
jgi:hypothetical protein